MVYFAKTPWLLKKMYPAAIWDMPDREKVIYLTFDDGPHPEITAFVLEQLRQFNAKATFFCVGNNVVKYRDVYTNIINDGHKIGNHTYNHLNGWKTGNEKYFTDIAEAGKYIDSDLFRPPYGRISKLQLKYLTESINMKVIMWSVLSGDFDQKITPETCLKNIVLSTKNGGIVVFHDSEKAFKNMQYALPKTLEYFEKQDYRFDKINL